MTSNCWYKETGIALATKHNEKISATVHGDAQLVLSYARYKPKRHTTESCAWIKPKITLLFAHGTGLVKETWEPLIEMLFTDPKVWPIIKEAVVYDQRNHGQSAILNSQEIGIGYSWRDGARDILQLIDQLDLTKPLMLVGHSLGGAQSLYAAHLEPYKISSLFLIEPVLYRGDTNSQGGWKERLNLLWRISKDKFKDEEEWKEYVNKKSYMRKFTEPARDIMVKYGSYKPSQSSKQVYSCASSIQQMLTFYRGIEFLPELFPLLQFIKHPIYYIAGAEALWNPRDTYEKAKYSFVNAKTVLLKGAAHNIPVENPELLSPHLRDFINTQLNQFINDKEETVARHGKEIEENDLLRQDFIDIMNNSKQKSKL